MWNSREMLGGYLSFDTCCTTNNTVWLQTAKQGSVCGPMNEHLGLCDEDITPSHTHNDPLLDIQGSITRARARQLNLEVSSFLSNSLYDSENKLLPNDYIVLRYEERSRRHMEEVLEAWRTSEAARIKMEDQTKLSSSMPCSSWPVCFELVT
jgi:hypothetical protein